MASPLDLSLPLLLVVAGIVLIVAEAIAPGAHLIVLGVALLGAGLVALTAGSLFPPLAGTLIETFVLALLVLVFGGAALYVYREYDFYRGTGVGRTRDSDSLRGRTGRVTERVTRTAGQVKLDRGGFNPFYSARATSGEIGEGEEVIVVDPGGGNVVTVEPIAIVEDDIERELAMGRGREAVADAGESEEAEEGTGQP